MITAFKTFWSDYNEMVLQPELAWIKKHWKGYLVFVGLCGLVGATIGYLWWYEKPALDDEEDSSDEE